MTRIDSKKRQPTADKAVGFCVGSRQLAGPTGHYQYFDTMS
jgi:hypothetical protein